VRRAFILAQTWCDRGGRCARASQEAPRENEAELDVSRDLFVRGQAAVGPIARSAAVPRRGEMKAERFARRHAERLALEREAQRRGAYRCITAHYAGGSWTAQGFLQIGRAQTVAGPFDAPTRGLAHARVIAHLLELCTGDSAGR
jgi:hypothetical protein